LVDAYWERLDPDHIDGDGAESFAQFIHRVSEAITWFRKSKDGLLAVFSHEQFILAVWWFLISAPGKIDSGCMRRFRAVLDAFPLPNGAIMEIQFSANDDKEIPFTRIRKSHLVS
jgi:broad specificity phosphatase PhoE